VIAQLKKAVKLRGNGFISGEMFILDSRGGALYESCFQVRRKSPIYKVSMIADIGLYANYCMEYREFVRAAY
jgi:hypothetical protein